MTITRQIRQALAVTAITVCLSACETLPNLAGLLDPTTDSSTLTSSTIAQGLREALTLGSARVVDSLGVDGGYLNSSFHIPLPAKLRQAQQIAQRFGLGGAFDDLEIRLNRAAEAAAPKARSLFVEAVRQMTFDDVMQIYRGPDDAATRYLERTTTAKLTEQMQPIIDQSLSQVGAVQTLQNLTDRYNRLPLVKPINADITGHVLGYAKTALFTELAKEEAAIRNDPVKRTTTLLKRVFGNS
ncbi:MAG: DUF4197 domain-containing protein [Gammaproteobacteria bacterium]|nr:DUF4197 domain-containing protein [Gammaproteobacteria bacterium]